MPYSRICVWELAGVSCDRRRATKEPRPTAKKGNTHIRLDVGAARARTLKVKHLGGESVDVRVSL